MKRVLIALLVAALTLVALVAYLNLRGEEKIAPAAPTGSAAQLVERGAYLARVGNCMTCHTDRGGAAFAGGRAIATPFGVVYSSNLTGDPKTGIGAWSADEFWRAMHNGRSRDGRLLYPAFPYPNYTTVTRADSDAIFAFLRSQPGVQQANKEHGLRWPFNTQVALAVWRALYFSPGSYVEDTRKSAEWNRGAYLVEGLGHCAACHTARNALGASANMMDLSGGLIPMQNWYAPALTSAAEAGVADWPVQDVVRVMQTGVSPRGSVLGPMAEVVLHSTQHWSDTDLRSMAVFLKALPQTAPPQVPREPTRVGTTVAERGAKLYEQHCVQCHGDQGQGVPGAYPPLAGNRAVLMPQTANLVQIVLHGGYAPATAGNPRPFGMPPYVLTLNDADIATVLTHIRTSWGNAAPIVTEFDVARQRTSTTQ
ncbi:MAG: alcohol dehydrogenase [Ramlibacter sp.]|jgi:mono/diheme cytochrome c family protein|nr:alcohol dehydrogenase [Ramlibacter sp.]